MTPFAFPQVNEGIIMKIVREHMTDKRRPPLELAAQTASTSFTRMLPQTVLADALTTGVVPDVWSSHIRSLLEEVPRGLLERVVEQLHAERRSTRDQLWENIHALSMQLRCTRDPRDPL